MSDATSTLLEVRGAVFRYGARAVLDGLNFDVMRGEVLCILGANGCGKSTLLRCIGGHLSLDAGAIVLDGADVARLTPAGRARRIGILFQQHVAAFPFRVLDVVGMGRAPHLGTFAAPSADDLAMSEQALAQVDALHLRDRRYTEISGGERQLVLLARTVVQGAGLVLLDEPTSHLDFRNQALSLKAIGRLAERGTTMVMTTHDPNHAFLFPGRVALMKEGRLLAVGPAQEVVTESALKETYGIDMEVVSVPGRPGTRDWKLCRPLL